MLLQIPEVLSAAELERIAALLARAEPEWSDGRATAGPQAATVKHNQQLPWRSASTQALQAIVLPALQRHAVFFSAALPKRILPPMFNRYGGEANSYGDHIDQAVRVLPDGSGRVRSDISCTVFLADPAGYGGGELVIEDSFGPQRVKLPAGHAVIYPGSSVHRVEPVTRGQRVASFFWIESMVRSAEQRRLLFDMDMALMRLRQQHGETPEAVTLTGTYHNLLRLWADT
jgi:PKHD-type hydroxylase